MGLIIASGSGWMKNGIEYLSGSMGPDAFEIKDPYVGSNTSQCIQLIALLIRLSDIGPFALLWKTMSLEEGYDPYYPLQSLAIGAKNNSHYMFLAVLEWIYQKIT